MVVAQFVERPLPTPEVRCLDPVISKLLLSTVLKRRKEKRPRMAHKKVQVESTIVDVESLAQKIINYNNWGFFMRSIKIYLVS